MGIMNSQILPRSLNGISAKNARMKSPSPGGEWPPLVGMEAAPAAAGRQSAVRAFAVKGVGFVPGIDAILDGSIKDATFSSDPVFNFDVPQELVGVPASVLYVDFPGVYEFFLDFTVVFPDVY